MFLKRARDKHSSPDQLDQLVRVVKPQGWLLLATTSGLLFAAIAWAWLGKVPITVSGDGILVYPTTVVATMAPATGKVVQLLSPGDEVIAGETVIAVLDLEDLTNQIDAERSRLRDLRGRENELNAFERERAEADREYQAGRVLKFGERIERLRGLLDELRAADRRYEDRQAQAIEDARVLSEAMAKELEERIVSLSELESLGLSTKDSVIAARGAKIENDLRIAELSVRASGVDLRRTRAGETYLEYEDLIRELELQRADAELQHDEVARRLRQAEIGSEGLIREAETRLELLLEQNKKAEIRSERDGIVLEVTVSLGELVPVGRRLCSLRVQDPDKPLMALAFFEVRDGKRIKRMVEGRPQRRETRVTPDTVRRESAGSIEGHVAFADAEFGEDWGLDPVSEYPITTAAAANEIGSLELAQNLLQGGNKIRVWSVLERSDDPAAFGGYRWTSGKGPPVGLTPTLSAGTTANVRVIINRVAPIDLVIPFLRALVEGDE